jgi:transposase InsO family protein
VLKREGTIVRRITAHRILLRNGLVREEDRHRAAVKRFEREAPNQLWQMDFKGMPENRKGCVPLVIEDDHSRYLNGLFDTGSTQAEPVRDDLITVFRRDGLPDAMLMDHGTPWWNTQGQSGWSWLTVWIMRQGIRLYLSGYRHPQTQGKVERCNGSLEEAMCKRGKVAEQSWQEWLDAYRDEYNHVRPHEALGMDVPAQHWAPSARTYLEDPKVWDYPEPADVRKVRENGGISLKGSSYFIGRAFIGEYVQLEFLEKTVLVWFCRTLVRELDMQTKTSYCLDYGQFDKARSQGL